MKFYSFYSLIIVFSLVLIFSLCFFIPIFNTSGFVLAYTPNSNQQQYLSISTSNFTWPVPGYNNITSNFGYRKSPTSGAGSYHGGVDIAVPTGSNIISASTGVVSYLGFYGANGFTVKVESGNLVFIYSHVSPSFLVYSGQIVNKGQVIAKVGPKNVYGIYNNPYKDSNGNPTNGATTGPHLHFAIKKDGKAVNPLNFFNYISSSSSSSWLQCEQSCPQHPSCSSHSSPQSNSIILLHSGHCTSFFNSS